MKKQIVFLSAAMALFLPDALVRGANQPAPQQGLTDAVIESRIEYWNRYLNNMLTDIKDEFNARKNFEAKIKDKRIEALNYFVADRIAFFSSLKSVPLDQREAKWSGFMDKTTRENQKFNQDIEKARQDFARRQAEERKKTAEQIDKLSK